MSVPATRQRYSGYDAAASLVKNAYLTGRTVREVALEQSGLAGERLTELLDPETQAKAKTVWNLTPKRMVVS